MKNYYFQFDFIVYHFHKFNYKWIHNVFLDFIKFNIPYYFKALDQSKIMQRVNETIISKGRKYQQTDDDGPLNKKMLKNQRKKEKKQKKDDEQIDIQMKQLLKITQNTYESDRRQKPINKQARQQQLTEQLQKVYIECNKETIRQCLRSAGYNMQLAANLIIESIAQKDQSMLDVFGSEKKINNLNGSKNNSSDQSLNRNNKKNQKIKKKIDQVQEEGYKLLNEFYDKASQMDISGFEFEELFNEITEIIKQDQKSKSKGLIEINNFMDICMTAKQTILVGLKDVFEMKDDIYIDEDDPIYAQLQQYKYDLILKEVRQGAIKAEDFPSFSEAANKKKNLNSNKNADVIKNNKKQTHSPVKQSIVNSLQNQNKSFSRPISNSDFFTGSHNKRPVLFQEKNSKGIFNIDNQQQSEDALRGLHKQFNHVSIQLLKVTYLSLQKNYNECRIFLNKYYGQYAKDQMKIQIQSSFTRNPRKNSYKKHMNFSSNKQFVEEIDEELKGMSFSQIRQQIQHLFNLRQVFRMTCANINNSNQKKQLMRMLQEKAPTSIMNKLARASRVKLIQETMQRSPNFVDLHGHREQQVGTILQGLVSSIKRQFNNGNEKVKYRTMGGRTEAVLQVLTGIGRHSLYGKSILKPYVKRWCDSRHIRAIVNVDNVQIYISLL